MGIDIYLGGYDRQKRASKDAQAQFDNAVKVRNGLPEGTPEAEAAQEIVSEWYDKMYAPETGYLRSSYNSSGLFNRLEEIFGVDVAALLFPGDWSNAELPIDADRFVRTVEELARVALEHVKPGAALPLVAETAERLGRLPDPHPARAGGEVFGAQVGGMLAALVGDGLKIETHAPEQPCFDPKIHGWYVTEGLRELHEFGKAAQKMSKRSRKPAWVYISY